MADEYSITIIPIGEDGTVKYHGTDYTTTAKKHFIVIGGVKYYIRQNASPGCKLGENVPAGLEAIFTGKKITSPITLTLKTEEA